MTGTDAPSAALIARAFALEGVPFQTTATQLTAKTADSTFDHDNASKYTKCGKCATNDASARNVDG